MHIKWGEIYYLARARIDESLNERLYVQRREKTWTKIETQTHRRNYLLKMAHESQIKQKSTRNLFGFDFVCTSNYGLWIVAKSFVDYYLYGINTNTGRQVFWANWSQCLISTQPSPPPYHHFGPGHLFAFHFEFWNSDWAKQYSWPRRANEVEETKTRNCIYWLLMPLYIIQEENVKKENNLQFKYAFLVPLKYYYYYQPNIDIWSIKIHMNSSLLDIYDFGVQANEKRIVKLICNFAFSHALSIEHRIIEFFYLS